MAENSTDKDLLDLLLSLDGNERRYIRLKMKGGYQKENKLILTLFEHLIKNRRWDTSELKAAIPGAGLLNQPNVARYKLQQYVLDALRDYHDGRSIQLEFSRRIDAVEILLNRKLYAGCRKSLKSARKWVSLLDHPAQELLLLKLASRLERQDNAPDLHVRLAELHARENILITQIRSEVTLTALLDELMGMLPQHGEAGTSQLTKVEEVLNSARGLGENLSFEGSILKSYVLAYAGFLMGDANSYFQHQAAIVTTWENNPHRIRLEGERYFKMLTGYAQSCRRAKRLEEVRKVIAKLQRLLSHNRILEKTERERVLLLRLNYSMEARNWQEGEALLPEITLLLVEKEKNLATAVYEGLLANAITLSLILEDWDNTIRLAEILRHRSIEQRNPVTSAWALITLCAGFYTKGDFDKLDKLIKQKNRQIKTKLGDGVLACIESLMAVTSPAEERLIFERLQDCIASDVLFEHFQIIGFWAEARAKGKALRSMELPT